MAAKRDIKPELEAELEKQKALLTGKILLLMFKALKNDPKPANDQVNQNDKKNLQ